MAVSPVHGLAAGQSSNVSIQVSCSSAVYYSNRFNAVLCQSALAFLPVPTNPNAPLLEDFAARWLWRAIHRISVYFANTETNEN